MKRGLNKQFSGGFFSKTGGKLLAPGSMLVSMMKKEDDGGNKHRKLSKKRALTIRLRSSSHTICSLHGSWANCETFKVNGKLSLTLGKLELWPLPLSMH